MFFTVNFTKFLRTAFIKELLWWLFLIVLVGFRVRKINCSSLLSVYELKGTNRGLFLQFIVCDSRTQSPTLLQNTFKFCTFLAKFSNILPFFLNIFYSLFEKPHACPYFLEQALPTQISVKRREGWDKAKIISHLIILW